MNDAISRQSVFDIVDELSHQMTIEGYWSMIERVKGLPSATCGNLEKPEIPQHSEGEAADCNLDCISRQMLLEYIHGEPVGKLLCDKYNLDGLIEQFPSAQPNLQPTCNQLATDCISRQAAIDALRLIPCDLGKRELEDAIKAVEQLPSARTEPLTIRVNNELTKEEYEKLMHDIKDAPIVLLPSAQPEKHTEKRTETRACDLIDRQAVTDTVRKIILGFFSDEDGVMTDTEKTLLSVNKAVCDGVRALPSAQPEVLACGEGELSAQPEIVRCKDCKYWRQQTNYAGVRLSFGFCESDYMWQSLYGETYEVSHIDTDDDFYCGYAERRTDGRSDKQTIGD